MENPAMFCYQCQETARGTGCDKIGVCGKQPQTSARMDLLLYAVRGVALINRALREKGEPSRESSHLVIDALFTTITNANFDNPSLDDYISRAFELKNLLAAVTPPDEAARAAAHAHWAALAKPLGGLGRLEAMVEDAAALTGESARSERQSSTAFCCLVV